MKLLAIDTSNKIASVAVFDNEICLGEKLSDDQKTHSEKLLPIMDELLTELGLTIKDIDLLAVSVGPGSFTGLRIGSATAKGLGLALKKPVVSVPTLDGLAYRMITFDGIICPVMDARRNQVYTAAYTTEDGVLKKIIEHKAVDINEIMEELYALGKKVIFMGDGVDVHRETIEKEYKGEFCFAPSFVSKQSAAAVASLGIVYFKEGKYETAAEHTPFYLRKSQAEREREEREKKNS